MKTKQILLLAALVVAATSPVKAGAPPPNLVITEVSEFVLTWTWMGGPTNGGTQSGTATLLSGFTHDAWTFDVPNALIVTPLGGQQGPFVDWKENDYATTGEVNIVRFFQAGAQANGSTVTVFGSDVIDNDGHPLVDNMGVFSFTPPISGGLTVQYIDNADSSESGTNAVPESGSTVVLLLISTAALLGVARRHLHPVV